MTIKVPPAAANNAAFLAVYNGLPAATRGRIESHISLASNPPMRGFGSQYVQNLSQHSYLVLPLAIQDTIAQEVATVITGDSVLTPIGGVSPALAMRLFICAMLP